MNRTASPPSSRAGHTLRDLCGGLFLAACITVAQGCGVASGHDGGPSTSTSTPPSAGVESNRAQIPDVVLVDQAGNEHRFYTDLIKGKLVLMNAIYTSCAGTCPMQTSIFTSIQRHLGDRVGKDIQMISVSLDPLTDSPSRLKEFAEKYQAKPGWTFLTGSKADVATVLKAMDLYTAVPEEHTPICAVGNEPTGVWMKVINLASPDEIISRLRYVENAELSSLPGM